MNLNNWNIINNRLFKVFRSVQLASQKYWTAYIHLRIHFECSATDPLKIWLWEKEWNILLRIGNASFSIKFYSWFNMKRKPECSVFWICYWLLSKEATVGFFCLFFFKKNNLNYIRISYVHHSFPPNSRNQVLMPVEKQLLESSGWILLIVLMWVPRTTVDKVLQ